MSRQRVRVAALHPRRRWDIEVAAMLLGGAVVGLLAALVRVG